MSDDTTPKYNADKLVAVYIKIRDAKAALVSEYEGKVADLEDQLATVAKALLEVCKATGQDGGKTAHGTFTRTVKTRYWTSDWNAMTKFIKEHDAMELLEQRLHQGNMKAFLTDNPDLIPEGLNADSTYSISVRRSTKLK